MNISTGFSYRATPMANVPASRSRITDSSSLLKCAIFLVSGVERFAASVISRAMWPISVWSPVAHTTPSPWPVATSVRFFVCLQIRPKP